jgi:TolB-like protein
MKYFSYILIGALILIGACATGDHQNQTALQEQRISSKELDKQIDILAEQIINSFAAQKTHKIAIIEFSNLDGNVTNFGKYLAEELTTRLFRTGRFEIIERQLIKKIMGEQKLSATGLVDEKSASKFGRILGVDALTTGTIADLNTSVTINARLIASETGSVFAVASVKIPMNKEIEILLGKKPSKAVSPDPKRFDGVWNVNIGCATEGQAHAYTYNFNANVKNGIFHGLYGKDGIAPCLTLDGKINPDGSSLIKAKGLTGNPAATLKNVNKGTPYSYNINAVFSDFKGTGTRIGNRVCNVIFVKQ